MLFFILLAAITNFPVLLKAPIYQTDQVKVTWSPNKEPDLSSYRVYIDVFGKTEPLMVAVTTDTFLIWQVAEPSKMMFYLTAVDRGNLESTASDTVTAPVWAETRLFGDMNGDSLINSVDHTYFWRAFGKTKDDPDYKEIFDIDLNGQIGPMDHVAFIINMFVDERRKR